MEFNFKSIKINKGLYKHVAPVIFLVIILYLFYYIGTLQGQLNVVGQGANQQAPAPAELNVSDFEDIFTISSEEPIRGNADANIVLIEYSDFECPFCKNFHGTVTTLLNKDSDVAWVYRHLPLPFHNTAAEASYLAECVKNNLGATAFWNYADNIFANSQAGSLAFYRSLATKEGLNDSQINSCLSNGSREILFVEEHLAQAQTLGINGTPGSILVNRRTGKAIPISGALPLNAIEQIVTEIR